MMNRIAYFCRLTLLASVCICPAAYAASEPPDAGAARASGAAPASGAATGSGSVAATATAPARVHHVTSRHHRRHAQARPVAPIASATPAPAPTPGSSPAPVPNEALNAPIDNQTQETSVTPSVFQLHYPPQGNGYTTGSSSQAMDDREAAKATGVEVKVPLPQ